MTFKDSESGMSGKRILVVEDDFLIRMTLTESLESELLTDMQLSGSLSGRALADAVRAENAILPIIFMTGRPDRIGAVDPDREMIIGKPYLPSEVCLAARAMLARG